MFVGFSLLVRRAFYRRQSQLLSHFIPIASFTACLLKKRPRNLQRFEPFLGFGFCSKNELKADLEEELTWLPIFLAVYPIYSHNQRTTRPDEKDKLNGIKVIFHFPIFSKSIS